MLAARGVEVLAAERGELACGEEGSGRMAAPEAIVLAVRRAFAARRRAGRSRDGGSSSPREARARRIDAVRFIGNRSSGKMGKAVADEAYLRGAEVVLVHDPSGGRVSVRRRDASRAPTRWPPR